MNGRHITSLAPTQIDSMIGAGYTYRKSTFVTHSTLPSHLSAFSLLNSRQVIIMASFLILLILGLVLYFKAVIIIFIALLTVAYFLDVIFTLFIIKNSLTISPELYFSQDELTSLDRQDLPVYSVLCPMYREAGVLPALISNLRQLDWPKDKLDVILLLEQDDVESIDIINHSDLPSFMRVVVVPPSLPKTKPKACNYGLHFVKGEYLVVYDAEDKPDPDQLKKAYLGFVRLPAETACLQAKLNYYNPHHNLLTRLFTVEYSLWFDLVLPGLQSINTTIPLGGTSNHFKTGVLKSLHGWDAFNVTEDCDLGARLFKHGYRTAIIDSTTFEEANSNLNNWIRQRSRWLKGYFQTFFVHNRNPIQFFREHGVHALIFQLVIGLRISFILINPLMWAITFSYFVFYSQFGPAIESIYPAPVFYMAVFSAVFGNFIFLYNNIIASVKRGNWSLVKYIYLIPVYWLFISLAAVKAFHQLIFKPHFWEKTHHGLHLKKAQSKTVKFAIPMPAISIPVFQPVFPRLSFSLPVLPGRAWSGLVLVGASLITGLAGFGYNAYLSRNVTIEIFGVMSFLSSIMLMAQIPLSALSRTFSHHSAHHLGANDSPAGNFWRLWRGRVKIGALLVSILWLVSLDQLAQFFNIQDILPLILFTPVWLMSAYYSVDSGFLSGNLKFVALSFMMFLEGLVKLAWVMAVGQTDYSMLIYAALPLSLLIPSLIGNLVAHRVAGKIGVATDRNLKFPLDFYNSSLLIGISTLAFFSLDVLLAKHYLSPVIAGMYALLAMSGKMVYFISQQFQQLITPLVSHDEGRKVNSKKTFQWILLAILFANIASFAFINTLGRPLLLYVFGPKMELVFPHLTSFTLAVAGFSVASAIVAFKQAKRQLVFPLVGMVAVGVQLGSIMSAHGGLADFTSGMLLSSGVYLGLVSLLHLAGDRLSILNNFLLDFKGLFQRISFSRPVEAGKLRILIFNWRDTRHSWAGGAEVYLHELAKNWVETGHTVTLFCGTDRKNPFTEKIDGVQIIRAGGFYTVYFWAFIYYVFKLRRHFDVIIDSENGVPFFSPLFSSVPVILLVYHVHQEVFRRQLSPVLSTIARFIEGTLSPFIYRDRKVATISHSSLSGIQSLGFGRKYEIDVIYPGINHSHYHRLEEKTSFPSFAYIGRIRPYKNVDVAIRAFNETLKLCPAAKFYIAGEGDGIKDLRRLAEELGIESSVYFLGRISEKEKVALISSVWAMLQPSSFEGWGITVIEANAGSTPVIASNIAGLRDSVRDGETGILVPVGNPKHMSAAMSFLATNPEIRKTMSEKSLTWAENFSWQYSASVFISIIYRHLEEARSKTATSAYVR